MSFHVWISFCALVVLLVSTPGPSVLLGMSHSMRYGPVPTLITAAGDVCANMIQMVIAAVGLGAVLATSATAFAAVKWAGVGFLIVMGLMAFFRKAKSGANGQDATKNGIANAANGEAGDLDAKPAASVHRETAKPFKLFGQGFLVAAGNPKAIAFFGALFPQFIDAHNPLLPQLLILGATFVVFDYSFVMIYALGASRVLPWLSRRGGGNVINRFSGAVLIIAALVLSLIDPPSAMAGKP
jgi:threonine/homoserine/homoserine lactone efflux protein